jgi:hypothetical protein
MNNKERLRNLHAEILDLRADIGILYDVLRDIQREQTDRYSRLKHYASDGSKLPQDLKK